MALQVWLPLNGSLENKGLSDVTVVNGGAVINDAGKIGKCYEFERAANYKYLTLPSMASIVTNHSYSISAWIKTGQEGCVASITYGVRLWTHSFIQMSTASSIYCYSDTNVTDNMWHHVCGTYDVSTGQLKYYVDGICSGTATNSNYSTSWGNETTVGVDINNNAVAISYFGGLINDVRIYDHCLSAAEVKEISKALMIHYPMNDPYISVRNWKQIVNNGNFANDVDGWNWSGMLSGYTIANGVLTYSGVNYYQYFIKYMYDFIPDHIYCFRCQYKHNYSTTINWEGKHEYGSGIYVKHLPPSDSFVGFSNYFTALSASAGTMFQVFGTSQTDSATISFKNCMLFDLTDMYGAGNEPSEENFLSMFNSEYYNYSSTPIVNNGTVYDCSGNGNDGNCSGTEPISSPDTPRYGISYLSDHSKGIYCNINHTFDVYTISFWQKLDPASHGTIFPFGSKPNRTTSDPNFYWYADNSYRFHHNTDNELYYDKAVTRPDGWVHCVAVYDGAKVIIYRNGVNAGEMASTGTATFNWISLLDGLYNTSSYCYAGNVSDFRMYATALSQEDILELYNTPAKISKNGTLMCYEVKES